MNKVIGGARTSQHMMGEAFDLKALDATDSQIFHFIKDNLNFDQLIWEFGDNVNPDWVHVSLSRTHNRKQILKAYKQGGKTLYKPF